LWRKSGRSPKRRYQLNGTIWGVSTSQWSPPMPRERLQTRPEHVDISELVVPLPRTKRRRIRGAAAPADPIDIVSAAGIAMPMKLIG
jgi:hypothetical protein